MAVAATANQVFRQLRGEHDPAESSGYLAIPGGDAARWLLPAGNAKIGQVLASWTPYRLHSRIAWTAIRAASRVGRIVDVPGVATVEVEGVHSQDWESLGWRLSDAPVPVIYLGTPGPRRKAVVHLVGRATARCRAVVKVPLTDEAKVAVLHEAEALEALAGERYEFSPRLLYVDRDRGITTQTFVEGQPGQRKLRPEYWRLLHSLVSPSERTSIRVHADRLGDTAGLANMAEALEALQDDSPLPVCWEHGDFVPWNIKCLPDGRCALLDWEDARRDGLPLMDAFHFLHMQDFLFGRRPRLHSAQMQQEAIELGISPSQVRKVETAYLISAYVASVRRQQTARIRFVSRTLELCRGVNA